MKPIEKDFQRALGLLEEMRKQDSVTEMAWDSAACRRWIKKTDKLLDKYPSIENPAVTAEKMRRKEK